MLVFRSQPGEKRVGVADLLFTRDQFREMARVMGMPSLQRIEVMDAWMYECPKSWRTASASWSDGHRANRGITRQTKMDEEHMNPVVHFEMPYEDRERMATFDGAAFSLTGCKFCKSD